MLQCSNLLVIFRHPIYQGPGLQLDFVSCNLKTSAGLNIQNAISLFKQFQF